jgi:dihydroflavonol-4-reductase
MVRDHLRGRPVPLPLGGRPAWSFVHVDDVAAAHLLALDAVAPPPALVLGGENAGLQRLFSLVAELTGRRAPRLSVPYAGLWLAGAGEELLERLCGRAPTRLTRGAAKLLREDWALDSALATTELNWSARSLPALVHDTIAWMEEQGLVRRGTLNEPSA